MSNSDYKITRRWTIAKKYSNFESFHSPLRLKNIIKTETLAKIPSYTERIIYVDFKLSLVHPWRFSVFPEEMFHRELFKRLADEFFEGLDEN
jgi:hypothetical protein